MISLHRHQLARLTDAGWSSILQRPWDDQALECLAHWTAHRLPLVVTRQPLGAISTDLVALGLPSPARWDRRRLALQVPHSAVWRVDEFPRLSEVLALLPHSVQRPMQGLLAALDIERVVARVFGSYGWQSISGLAHVRPGSDLDLWVAVNGAAQADAAAHVLQAFGSNELRLDGELVFGDGSAVAWREWIEWRAGRARALMVKQLGGVSLQIPKTQHERPVLTEAFE